MLEEGRVTVDGSVAGLGARAGDGARIEVDGVALKPSGAAGPRLIVYNKPRGQIVSRSGMNQVFDHLPALESGRWVNVGRLDVDTEGLLLFTDDGDLANGLAHPSANLLREYVVRAKEMIDDEAIKAAVEKGVDVSGETVRPARLGRRKRRDTANNWYEIALTQGRNRVVRRLFECLGARVNRLVRVRFGDFELPRDLPSGRWREVEPPEGLAARLGGG